ACRPKRKPNSTRPVAKRTSTSPTSSASRARAARPPRAAARARRAASSPIRTSATEGVVMSYVITPEQRAAMTEAEVEQTIAQLEAALAELRRPVPQPYPKWVTIHGQSMIVQSEEEEKRLSGGGEAAPAASEATALHGDANVSSTHKRRG